VGAARLAKGAQREMISWVRLARAIVFGAAGVAVALAAVACSSFDEDGTSPPPNGADADTTPMDGASGPAVDAAGDEASDAGAAVPCQSPVTFSDHFDLGTLKADWTIAANDGGLVALEDFPGAPSSPSALVARVSAAAGSLDAYAHAYFNARPSYVHLRYSLSVDGDPISQFSYLGCRVSLQSQSDATDFHLVHAKSASKLALIGEHGNENSGTLDVFSVPQTNAWQAVDMGITVGATSATMTFGGVDAGALTPVSIPDNIDTVELRCGIMAVDTSDGVLLGLAVDSVELTICP
jgi:hypothetical protein